MGITTLLGGRSFFNLNCIVDTTTDFSISSPAPAFAHLNPAPAPLFLWPSPHCCLYLRVMHICYLSNLFTFFHPVPPPGGREFCSHDIPRASQLSVNTPGCGGQFFPYFHPSFQSLCGFFCKCLFIIFPYS